MTGFENQLQTQLERDIFFTLEVSTRSCKSAEDIEKAFASMQCQIDGYNWADSLKTALIEFSEAGNERPTIREYCKKMFRRYIGRATLANVFNEATPPAPKGLSQFTEEELNAHHLQWIIELDSKYHEYMAKGSDVKPVSAVAMAKYSTLAPLTDEELLKLYTSFTGDCDYNCSMSFAQWADWFVESKGKFDHDGNPNSEFSQIILKYFELSQEQELENAKYFVSQKIHPFHEEQAFNWITGIHKSMLASQ